MMTLHMPKEIIEIDAFNPYDGIYPNRKVITKDILVLIKTLRANGYEVVVFPNDGRKIEYLFKKGDTNFLADPFNQILINIPLSIAVGLVTNWLQKILDKRKDLKLGKKHGSNVIVNDIQQNKIQNAFTKNVLRGEINDKKKKRRTVVREFEKCLKTKSPIPGLPFPILLEHRPIIIGWCRLKDTDTALEIDKGIITDKNIYRKMQNGKFKGGSVTGIARRSVCSICQRDYVECDHIAGNQYEGVDCHNEIIKADFIEVSVVKDPINVKTYVKLL